MVKNRKKIFVLFTCFFILSFLFGKDTFIHTVAEDMETGQDETNNQTGEEEQTGTETNNDTNLNNDTGMTENNLMEAPVVFVAQIWEQENIVGIYESLDAAFAAATAGQTVQLISDINAIENIVVKPLYYNIQFDLNGYTIRFYENSYFINQGIITKIYDSTKTTETMETALGGIFSENAPYVIKNTGTIVEIAAGNYVSMGKHTDSICIYNSGTIGVISGGFFAAFFQDYEREIYNPIPLGTLLYQAGSATAVRGGTFIGSTMINGTTPFLAADNIAVVQDIEFWGGFYRGWRDQESPVVKIIKEDGTPKSGCGNYSELEWALEEVGEGDTLRLLKDVTVLHDIVFSKDYLTKGIAIDFCGYIMEFGESASFVNNGYIRLLYDSTWETASLAQRGGVRQVGTLDALNGLFYGTGKIDVISSGRYETASGDLFQINGTLLSITGGAFRNTGNTGCLFEGKYGMEELSITGGIFICENGTIIYGETIKSVQITGGHFVFHQKVWEGGKCTFPSGRTLKKCSVDYLSEESYGVGWELAVVAGKVEMENTDTDSAEETEYYIDFYQAFETAQLLSSENDGKIVTISLNEDTYLDRKVVLDSNANIVIYGGDEGYSLFCAEGYDGNLLVVKSGGLCLNRVIVDGNRTNEGSEPIKRNGALIWVGEGGLLTLTNGATVKNNISAKSGSGIFLDRGAVLKLFDSIISDNITDYYGGGIYASDNATIEVCGTVKISGNFALTSKDNVFLENAASIIQVGDLTKESKIGVTHYGVLVKGLTKLASVEENYADSVGTPRGLETFVSDQDSEAATFYVPELKQIIWVEANPLLPESGVVYWELFPAVGAVLLLVLAGKRRRKAKFNISILYSMGALVLFTVALALGFSHAQAEQKLLLESKQVLLAANEQKSRSVPAIEEAIPEQVELIEEEINAFPDDGREYEGIISISDLNLDLLILSQYSDADMKTMPCVYSGSLAKDNLVIVGHNYNKHFGKLNRIEDGTQVILTDINGIEHIYKVTMLEVLEPNEVDRMITGDWDLTLFTCTFGNEKRLAIRCDKVVHE